jgi:tRNA(fMet)-specific endonuclease VapC
VHGIYRAKSLEPGQRRSEYIEELLSLLPVHPITTQTAGIVGQIEGQEAAKGNVLPFNDFLIAAAAIEQGYAVLTKNARHFERIPGLDLVRL